MEKSPATVAMVFAGGLGLAAYHAGAYQAFSRRSTPLHWVAGSSAGAVTAALIAGNRSEKRIERLRAFWNFPPTGELSTRRLAASVWLDRCVGHSAHWQPRPLSSTHAVDGSIRLPQSLRSQSDARAN